MGYIAITARDNQSLEEKTDREGFSDNPSYRNFRELLRYFVSHVGEAQEFLRRGWNDFKSLKVREPLNIADSVTPEDLTSSVKSALSRAPSYRLALSRTARKLTETADHSETLKPLSSQPNLSDKEKAEYDRFLVGADKTLSDARQIVNEVDEYFRELSKAEQLSQVLSDQIEALREQMRQMHELIALGLTAEALSHQIATLASSLAERNDQILRYLRGAGPRDSRLISYAEHVKSVIAGLRKELSYLAPSLQYVRERRDEFYVHDLATELLKRHLAGFSAENISMRVTGSAASNFRVKVNKGKMVQVFENLLINAEYWLKEDLRLHRIMHGQIDIETKRPMVFVSDNGRGVDPRLEDTLFEPFVSGKGKGKGRGLGLFIVQQLLSSEGCFVSLSEERNKFERRFRFEMDLKGMLTD
jgi:signal transduction histidine kinase